MIVNGNLKGLRGPINITNRTLIVGPTSSGKSRIVEALRFALTGEIPLLGRDSVRGAALLRTLLPEGETKLWATVTAADGTVYGAILDSRARTVKLTLQRPGEEYPSEREAAAQTPFAVTEVRDALTASPENALKWIATVIGLDVKASVANAIEKLKQANVHDTLPVEYLGVWAAGEASADEAIEAGSNAITQLESSLDAAQLEAAQYKNDVPVPSDADIQRAEDAAQAADSAVLQWAAHDSNAAAYLERVQEWTALQGTIALDHNGANVPPIEARDYWRHAVALINGIASNGATNCPVCAAGLNHAAVQQTGRSIAAWLVEADKAAEFADKAIIAARRQGELAHELTALQAKLDPARVQMIAAGQYTPLAPLAEEHAAKVRAYRDALQRAVVASSAPTIANREVSLAQTRLSAAKTAFDALKREIAETTGTKVQDFETRVQQYLPRSWGRFEITLRPNVHIGLDGCVPSDGREAVILTAIALAIATRPIIAVLPDRQLDYATAREVLETFGSVPLPARATLVAMSTHEFGQAPPIPGWSLIDARTCVTSAQAPDGAALAPVLPKSPKAPAPEGEEKAKRGRKPKEEKPREPTTPENDAALAMSLPLLAQFTSPPVMLSELVRVAGDAGMRAAGKTLAKHVTEWALDGWITEALVQVTPGSSVTVLALTEKGAEWVRLHVPAPASAPVASGEAF